MDLQSRLVYCISFIFKPFNIYFRFHSICNVRWGTLLLIYAAVYVNHLSFILNVLPLIHACVSYAGTWFVFSLLYLPMTVHEECAAQTHVGNLYILIVNGFFNINCCFICGFLYMMYLGVSLARCKLFLSQIKIVTN